MAGLNILIVHNYYQFAGGEDTVVSQDAQLLEKHGHHVFFYKRNNEELKNYSKWKKLLLPFTTFFSIKSYKEVRSAIRKNKIDIVHVHNTLPLVSYSVYYAAKKEHVRLVQTIHNFRLVCPNALLYRDGHICEECICNGMQVGIKHGCYRNSKLQTAVVAVALKLHRLLGTFDIPDAYIALTQFNKDKISSVVKSEKIFVKPNYLHVPNLTESKADEQAKLYYVYAARLEAVKGIFVLLRAFRDMPDKQLILLGSGPDEQKVKEYIMQNHMEHVKCTGFVEHKEALNYVRHAKAVIYPSLWYEGFPMTIVESFACGTPVLVSDTPNLAETVKNGQNGYTYTTGEARELCHAVNTLESLENVEYNRMRANALFTYKDYFTENVVYDRMMEIYGISNK